MMELGNMLMGHSRGEVDVPRTAAFEGPWQELCDELKINWYGYADPGCLIPSLENDVFKIRSYDWGAECDCGFDDEIDQWWDQHPHKQNCYLNEKNRRTKGMQNTYDSNSEYSKTVKKLCKERGLSYPECSQVHCDCGVGDLARITFNHRSHKPDCRIVQPNFLYKPDGFKIMWYKYPFRDSYMSPGISDKEWRKKIRHCIDSVKDL